jgi:formylglycine-generating enzyme required for sulfatase activity
MRYVPPTGAPTGEEGFQWEYGTDNIATISRGYWMGETEVTQELWTAVMGVNPSHERHDSIGYLKLGRGYLARGVNLVLEAAAVLDRLGIFVPHLIAHGNPMPLAPGEVPSLFPVETISWYDAIAFCNKLSVLEGRTPVYSVEGYSNAKWRILTYDKVPTANNAVWNAAERDPDANGYRLPTEMEWLWAAMGAERGGAGVRAGGYAKHFAGAGGTLSDFAWEYLNAGSRTHQTGMKGANELGLFDMSGNVHEWCQDWSAGLPAGMLTNYEGPGTGTVKVTKGTYFWSQGTTKLSARGSESPNYRGEPIGLRIVRSKN